MDWLQDLIRMEAQLRGMLAALGMPSNPGSASFEAYIRPAIEEIQAALDDYLCGRDAEEQARMGYEVRLNLPVFSHLRSLYTLISASEA